MKAEQSKLKVRRLVFIDETAVTTKTVRLYSKLKSGLRKGAARTVDALTKLVGTCIKTIAPTECAGYFKHAGYKA